MASDRGAFGFVLISVSVDADGDRSMYFSHLGVSLISVKPLTTENTENKTTPKISKITVREFLVRYSTFQCAQLCNRGKFRGDKKQLSERGWFHAVVSLPMFWRARGL